MDAETPVTGYMKPMDDDGVVLAYLRMDRNGTIRFMWLPEIFREINGVRMDDGTRSDIVDLLRLYANKLESREMDARLQHFADINVKGHQA